MKTAVLGKGKTGSKVIELLKDRPVDVYDRSRPPTADHLSRADIVICFLPGPAFQEILPILLDCEKPVVTGSTGWEGAEALDQKLKSSGRTWIWGTNFALGMNVVKLCIEQLSKASRLGTARYAIHEIHHTRKLDAPSGTALSWQRWLGQDASITSERTGDVIGIHELTLQLPFEKISLRHEAEDRKIFAQGAIWAAEQILSRSLRPGLIRFDELVSQELL